MHSFKEYGQIIFKEHQSIMEFFQSLFEQVTKDAPKWTSSDTERNSYNFNASIKYVQERFPDGVDIDTFEKCLIRFVTQHLNQANYPTQGHISWFVGVLAAGLQTKNQHGIVLDQFVPKLWADASQGEYNVRVGEFVNPAILDALPDSLKPEFAKKCAEMIKASKADERFTLLASHAQFGAHIGDYCLEEPKSQILSALVKNMGAKAFVAWVCEDENFLTHLISLSHILTHRLTENTAREVVAEIDQQIEFKNLIANFSDAFEGQHRMVPSWAAKRVFGHMLRLLPEEKQQHYSMALLSALGEDSVRILTFDLSWMDGDWHAKFFMEGLPAEAATKLIKKFVDTAWSEKYSANGEDANACEAFNHHINFATSIYALLPQNLLGFFRDYVAQKLESARETEKEDAILKASLLTRSIIAQKEPVRTREVDFYVVRSFDDCSRRLPTTAAHIKPSEQRPSGVFTSRQFIGSLTDYWDVLNHEDYSAPRWRAPNRRELFPSGLYRSLGENFLSVAEANKAPDPSLPLLLDVLRAREP